MGNFLKRHRIPLVPECKQAAIRNECLLMPVGTTVATEVFTTAVWTWGELVTYDVVLLIHLGNRRMYITGTTLHPNERWMMQIARNMMIAD